MNALPINQDNSENVDLLNRIPPFLLKAALYVEKVLLENGFEVYLVGGSVRDLLIKKKISDLDFTTNAHPKEIKKIFPRTIPVGEEFGTILVLYHQTPIEVTTYRSDGQYKDGRRPDSVVFGNSLYEDVIRRDFTINGMAYQISQKLLIDFIGGRKDLQSAIIKTIGNPMERFQEDGLRPIRGCRIMANLGFNLDENTRQAMHKNLAIIRKIAPERFYDEIRKTLKIKQKHRFWNTLKETGIFGLFFAEFKGLLENEKKWNHLLSSIEHAMPRNMAIYMAHFFYQEFCREDSYALPGSTEEKNLVRNFFLQNRFPSKIQKLCISILASPLLSVLDEGPFFEIPELKLKKALAKIPQQDWFSHIRFVKEILYRHAIDFNLDISGISSKIIKTLRDYKNKKFVMFIHELKINGNDLINLGAKGMEVGRLLEAALEYVIENPQENQPKSLLDFVRQKRGDSLS